PFLACTDQLAADAAAPVGGIDVEHVELAVRIGVAARTDADEAGDLRVDLGHERWRKAAMLVETLLERRPPEGVCRRPRVAVDPCLGLRVLRGCGADQHAPEPTLRTGTARPQRWAVLSTPPSTDARLSRSPARRRCSLRAPGRGSCTRGGPLSTDRAADRQSAGIWTASQDGQRSRASSLPGPLRRRWPSRIRR